jgi:two-component system cell cycle response regulator DivK
LTTTKKIGSLRVTFSVHAGFRTVEAGTGGDAVSLAAEQLPDLVLMDIRLPDMDGTEALRLLKADERTAGIPVVALTAAAMAGDRERFLEDGFDDYLEKPINVRDFGDQIRSRLR